MGYSQIKNVAERDVNIPKLEALKLTWFANGKQRFWAVSVHQILRYTNFFSFKVLLVPPHLIAVCRLFLSVNASKPSLTS